MKATAREAMDMIAGGGQATRPAALALVDAPLDELLALATRVRERYFGKRISLCAIANARSGLCGEDCAFCAQASRYATGAVVYPMIGANAILQRAELARRMHARHFGIVTSGRSLSEGETEIVCTAIRSMRTRDGITPCASLGELSGDAAVMLKAAGLARYHHNLESGERFFRSLCTTHSWHDRVRTVRAAKDAGLEVCAGGIFGCGEGWADRIDLACTLRELDVRSVPLNFLTPVPGTPLGHRPLLPADDALRITAIFRLLLPRSEIRIAAGRELVLGEAQGAVFAAGANAMMVGDYLTTRGRRFGDDERMIAELGLAIE